MIVFPGATIAQAVACGQWLADAVSRHLAQPPIRLAFERVLCPFLLLHTNRYAGVEYGPGITASKPSAHPLCHNWSHLCGASAQMMLLGACTRLAMTSFSSKA